MTPSSQTHVGRACRGAGRSTGTPDGPPARQDPEQRELKWAGLPVAPGTQPGSGSPGSQDSEQPNSWHPTCLWRRTFTQADGSQAVVSPSSQTHGVGPEVAPGVPQADGSQAAKMGPSSQTSGVGSEVAPGVPQADGSQAVVSSSSQTHGAGSEVAPGSEPDRLAPRQTGARQPVIPSSQTHGAGPEVAPGVGTPGRWEPGSQ